MKWKTTGNWTAEEAVALRALGPLAGSYMPWTSFALRPTALVAVIDAIVTSQARFVVELGSGLSTVYLARLFRRQGATGIAVVSVDDDARWLGQLRGYLAREDLTRYVELVCAPRAPWAPSSPEPALGTLERARLAVRGRSHSPLPELWYASEPIRAAIGARTIDFLLVDGPRGRRTISRYPALPELIGYLDQDATVALDDAHRAGEIEVLDRWSRASDFEFVTDEQSGLALGRRR